MSHALSGRERLLRTLDGQPVDRPPAWFMRQAGRYLPEYRALRSKHSFSEMYRTPALAAEVTVQPIRRFGFDAAILFSDILVIPEAMGLPVEFADGGPTLAAPLRSGHDLDRLNPRGVADRLDFVMEAIRLVRTQLGDQTALLGFAGAPYTLACYSVDGRGGKDFIETKRLEWTDPGLFEAILDRLTDAVAEFLVAQVRAGADAVQLFDSWGGHLSPEAWERWALPRNKRILDAVRAAGGRSIHFVLGGGHFLPTIARAGADVVGVDWHTSMAAAVRQLGPDVVVQGNLEPYALLGAPEGVRHQVRRIVAEGRAARGHIFNVGHGVTPQTRIECVEAVLDELRRIGAESHAHHA